MSTGERRTPCRRPLHESLTGYVDRGDIPGMVYLVDIDGALHVEAIGERTLGGPAMTRDTIFRIASMTKPVVAAAAMVLVDEGRLSLGQPVDEYLPELANPTVLRSIDAPLDDTVLANRPITVDDVLTLRLGFGVFLAPPGSYPIQRAISDLNLGDGPPNPDQLPDQDEWMRRLGSLPLMHQPGEQWMYNMGSDVLGVLVARTSGMSLEDFLRDRIFEPLGMTDTGFSVPDDRINRLATSYGLGETAGSIVVHDSAKDGQWSRPPAFQSGASGLVSTVDDYYAFTQMLLNLGEYQGIRILSRTAVERMTDNHLTEAQQQSGEPILEPGMGWGYGMAVITTPHEIPCSAGTYGWNGGLGTTWTTDPVRRITAILLTQMNWTSPISAAASREFLKLAFQVGSV